MNKAVAFGFKTRSDMTKEPTAATTETSMLEKHRQTRKKRNVIQEGLEMAGSREKRSCRALQYVLYDDNMIMILRITYYSVLRTVPVL